MSLLPDHAVAQLVMLEGDVCSIAEQSVYIETFGYQEDPHQAGVWFLIGDDAEHAECRLVVENEGELFTVYGQAVEHFTNVNYVLNKFGWTKSSVLARDKDIEAKLLARLVSVDVVTTSDDMPASTLQASMHPVTAPTERSVVAAPLAPELIAPVALEGADATHELDDSHLRIEQLTVRCNSAEERAAELESTNAALANQNDALRTQLREANARLANMQARSEVVPPVEMPDDTGPASDAQRLVAVIERHALTHIDLSEFGGSPLLADLRAVGYEPRLRLIKVA
ncbi:hypothetical protein ACT2FY_39025 [Paraburkholderia fungorum]|uniref:hypothetical protein n=1 Tax=Paraburkholderia fungorum TaxID=134537 RepID=UPI00402B349C